MATTRNYVWRTAPTGTEGTNTVYVDSYLGSDIYGNGMRQKPYKTLLKGLGTSNPPSLIVCRGLFHEDIIGSFSCKMAGDFFGAATYDGKGIHNVSRFRTEKMILKNFSVTSPTPYYTGVGSKNTSMGDISREDLVTGLYGNNIILKNYRLWHGIVGNTYGGISIYNVVFSHSLSTLKINTHLNNILGNVTLTDNRIVTMKKGNAQLNKALFVDFDIISNVSNTYTKCLFSQDCRWYYLVGDTYNSSRDEEIVLSYGEGTTSETRRQELLDRLEVIYEERGVASASRVYPTFANCIFSGQTAAEILNDPENDDYTLIPGCDADLGDGVYIGALPPSRKIPIMDDSTGVKETWDERSEGGCVVVNDGRICIDDTNEGDGEILSKVLTIDQNATQFNAVYANVANQFTAFNAFANANSFLAEEGGQVVSFGAGDELTAGDRYLMTDPCVYNGVTVGGGDVLVCQEADEEKSFTSDYPGCRAQLILEPNVMEVLYCRCRNAVYARVGVNDDLQAGATYLNDSGASITYHDRTIANGEPFVCMIDGERFTCDDASKKVAVLFDDTRVPAVEWVPAQTFGEYFVAKQSGAILKDVYGVPRSSGNLRAYPTTGLNLSTMDRKYVQLAIKVKRHVARVD